MSIKSILAKPLAKIVTNKFYKESNNAVAIQQKVFNKLVELLLALIGLKNIQGCILLIA